MGTPSFVKAACLSLIMLMSTFASASAAEPDLPLAAASPMTGVSFDDQPLFLPIQKSFEQAMLDAGNEVGRNCGKMEAYGWHMKTSEQGRVDKIFNGTVDHFRSMGYEVDVQQPKSASHDVTLFTADNAKKHFLSMWSTDDIGLAMVLCETGISHRPKAALQQMAAASTLQPVAQPTSLLASESKAPLPWTAAKISHEDFSPMGTWVGNYACGQGYTGGTLTISKLQNGKFEGVFHFYPTTKNPNVPNGSYTVYGEYDPASQRILINPGRWLLHPENYSNTVLIGSFAPTTQSLSAYFQGIDGCTSFEAKLTHKITAPPVHRRPAKIKARKVVKPVANVPPLPATALEPSTLTVGAPTTGAK